MHQSRGRKIVILGVSHCGSTVTSTVMNALPGVLGIGESHWLTKRPRAGCTLHGPTCPLISKLDRKKLNDWILYDELLRVSGKQILVTSDKAIPFVEPCIRPKHFDAIILFKRPESFAASGIRGNRRIRPVRALPPLFVQWYTDFLHWTSIKANKTVVLEYESFVARMDQVFPKLCKELNLPPPPKKIVFPPPGAHNVMGNQTTFKSPRYKHKPILLDDRWKHELTLADKKFIQGHKDCQKVWSQLQKKAIR